MKYDLVGLLEFVVEAYTKVDQPRSVYVLDVRPSIGGTLMCQLTNLIPTLLIYSIHATRF